MGREILEGTFEKAHLMPTLNKYTRMVGPKKMFYTKVRFLRVQAKETRAVLDARLHLLICRQETDRSVELFNSCPSRYVPFYIRNCKRCREESVTRVYNI